MDNDKKETSIMEDLGDLVDLCDEKYKCSDRHWRFPVSGAQVLTSR